MKIKKMKIKPIAGAILGLAVTTAVALPVKADDSRNCRIDRNTGVQICENRNNPNQRYDTVEQRIDQLYREVLGRRADRAGLRAYSDRIMRAGWDYARVRRELARSAEARENIRNSYRQIIGRNPDSDTIRRYQVNLERGWSLDRVRQDIARSGERNRNRRDDRYSRVEQRIDRLYREVLGRRADRAGLRTYSDRMLRGGWDENRVRQDLARSQEARNAINQLYREILGRNADPGGLRTYQGHLERGWSLDRVRRELQNSPEARNRNRRSNYRRY